MGLPSSRCPLPPPTSGLSTIPAPLDGIRHRRCLSVAKSRICTASIDQLPSVRARPAERHAQRTRKHLRVGVKTVTVKGIRAG